MTTTHSVAISTYTRVSRKILSLVSDWIFCCTNLLLHAAYTLHSIADSDRAHHHGRSSMIGVSDCEENSMPTVHVITLSGLECPSVAMWVVTMTP